MRALSEFESRGCIEAAGVAVAPASLAGGVEEAVAGAETLGYPVVVKACGVSIAHKTERGLVRLGLGDGVAVGLAAGELLAMIGPDDGDVSLLVASQVPGARELILGLDRDASFGMTVMLGVGGVLAEALSQVVFRLAPLDPADVHEMIEALDATKLLGEFRGEAAVDIDALAAAVMALSALADAPGIASVDVNPLKITPDGAVVAVDALVIVEET